MPAVGGGGRGNAGKSTRSAKRRARRQAAPTTTRVVARKQPWTPPSSRSDAAQRPGAQTQKKQEAANRGRSDAAAPAGAGGYRTTARERAVRDREIRQASARVKGRRRAGSGFRALKAIERNTTGVQTAGPGIPVPAFARRGAQAVAGALYEAPGKTTAATARGFKDAAVGFPGAAVAFGRDTYEGTKAGDPLRGVKRSGKEYVEDVVRRYKPLLEGGDEGTREFKERLKEEGLAAEVFDATALIAGPGAAASRGVGRAAAAGKLGERARRTVSEPRRRVRSSGGEGREQDVAPGYFKAARQKARDEAAARAVERTVGKADRKAERPRDDGTVPAKGAVDAVVREAHDAGEVVPTRISGVEVSKGRLGQPTLRTRRAVSTRKIRKAERVSFARGKGRSLHAERRSQRAEGLTGGGQGAGRAYASLNRAEKRAYKAAIQGPRTPAAGKHWAEARIRRIEAAIRRGDVDEQVARELPVLRRMAAEPERHFTQHLARVAEEEVERGKRAAAIDPRLGDTPAERELTAEQRRNAPAFTVLGVKRRGQTTAQAERAARDRRDKGRRDRARGERRLEGANRRVGAAEESAKRLVEQGKTRDAAAVVRSERAVEIHTRAAANHRRRAERSRSAKMREGHTRKAEAAEERAAAASKRTADAIGRTAASNPRLRKRVVAAHGRRDEVRKEIARAEGEIKAAAAEGRTARSLRRQYGRDELDPRTAEPVRDFLERGKKRRDEAGYGEPGYFESTPRETVRHSLFTIGGFRHVPRSKKYRGVLFDQGREDGSFTSYAQGLARNFKAAHNWSLIADTISEHAFAWGRNKSVEELRKELERRGIDPDTVAFWNPGVWKEAGRSLDQGGAMGRLSESDKLLDQPDVVGETLDTGQAQVSKAVELATDTGRWAESRDWVVVPKGLMEELEADTRPSHWLWRGVDVVKGKQARILLGTSPAWLQFQVASNLLLTTLAGVGPLEIVRAQRWWRRLSDSERAAVEPYVGVGHFHDSLDQVKIGAASNGKVLNSYRAFKAHPFWHKPRKAPGPAKGVAISQLNPLDALFRLDNAQNNAFRKAVLYNRLKRDAYKRMGENVKLQQRILDRVMGHFRYTKPEATMGALARDHALLERHAESVRDFLGDYMTYTARERRTLGRAVMFYGFLRFSLRFAFYTMPVKHPLMTAIIGQLSQLQTQEVRRLLGGDEMPWAMGKFYYSSGGELKSINVARANPFLNTVTELDLSRDLTDQLRNGLRFLPPVYVALLDQAFSKSSFTNKEYRVEGETSGRPRGDYGAENRGRIFLNDLARLNAIYRSADKAASGGAPQGDDSLLGDRPTEYKRADIVAGIAQSRETAKARGGFWGALGRDLLPLAGQPDDSPEIAEKVRQARGTATPGKPDPETQKLIDAYGGAGPQIDQSEVDKLLKAYGP